MQLTITSLEDAGVDTLPPDILWSGTVGDFAVSEVPADGGVGGLVARNPYRTAVTIWLKIISARSTTCFHGGSTDLVGAVECFQ